MTHLDPLQETLYVPMLGRIYACERFPAILQDEAALRLRERLPPDLKEGRRQTQYTLLASACRSSNFDRHIAGFLRRKPGGVIVQLGCGLETTFNRMDDGRTIWFDVDLPEVIDYRRSLLPETERERYLVGDAFSPDWIGKVRRAYPEAPLLVTASGLFYYFSREKVFGLFRMLKRYGDVEVVFDAVNSIGVRLIGHYMKQVGHGDLVVCFYVDAPASIARAVGGCSLSAEPYYAHIPKSGMKPMTRLTMGMSDLLRVTKMVHLRFGS